jgi:hypothetical protein
VPPITRLQRFLVSGSRTAGLLLLAVQPYFPAKCRGLCWLVSAPQRIGEAAHEKRTKTLTTFFVTV